MTNSFIREQISYIPQDVFLFSDTVKNNIAFNTLASPDEEMW
jgi:ATP-binding cassette subfamily B multidrug efflux pump